MAQNLASNLDSLHLDIKRFLFLRCLKAEVEFFQEAGNGLRNFS